MLKIDGLHRAKLILILSGVASISWPFFSSASDVDQSQKILVDYRQALSSLEKYDEDVLAEGSEKVEWSNSGLIVRTRQRSVRYLRSGSSRLVDAKSAPQDSSGFPFLEQVACRNQNTCFLVKRSAKDIPFQLKYLGQSEDALTTLFESYDMSVNQISTTLLSIPISSIINSAGFKLSNVEQVGNESGLIKLVVAFDHPAVPDVHYDGWLIVDRNQGWVLKSYELLGATIKGTRDVLKGSIDYAIASDGSIKPDKVESVIDSGTSVQRTTLDIQKYERTSSKASEFSLSNFGLGSLETTAPTWSISSGTSVFVVALFCLGLSILFRKLARINSVKERLQ